MATNLDPFEAAARQTNLFGHPPTISSTAHDRKSFPSMKDRPPPAFPWLGTLLESVIWLLLFWLSLLLLLILLLLMLTMMLDTVEAQVTTKVRKPMGENVLEWEGDEGGQRGRGVITVHAGYITIILMIWFQDYGLPLYSYFLEITNGRIAKTINTRILEKLGRNLQLLASPPSQKCSCQEHSLSTRMRKCCNRM